MKQPYPSALDAIRHLLKVDLNKVTWEQEQSAKTALQAEPEPSTFKLILAVNAWARALADVCRSYSAKCAEIQAACGAKSPAAEAVATILVILSEHLRLSADPADPFLILTAEGWPESNAVRDFVLEIAGAPINLVDGELVVTPTLPRWERPTFGQKLTFGQRIAGRPPVAPQGQNAAFLSVEETERDLRGLEESFRDVLRERLEASFSEAVLASYKRSQGFRALLQGSETDAAVGAPLTSATNQNMMVLNGDTWELHYSGAEGNADGTINDVDGIRYYALLIAETLKGRPTIPAEELVRLKNSRFSGPPNRGKAGEQEAAVYSESYQKTHEPTDQLAIRGGIDQSCTIEHKGAVIDDAVIDTDTVETCRKRIEIIDMELEGLKMKPNSTEADYALMEQRQAEKENIEDYLTRSTIPRNRNGRSARWAKFSHSGEKARKAVDMAMRRARKRMEKQDCLRPLVEHLVASVTAGRYLSYNGSHDWQIEGFPSRPKTRS